MSQYQHGAYPPHHSQQQYHQQQPRQPTNYSSNNHYQQQRPTHNSGPGDGYNNSGGGMRRSEVSSPGPNYPNDNSGRNYYNGGRSSPQIYPAGTPLYHSDHSPQSRHTFPRASLGGPHPADVGGHGKVHTSPLPPRSTRQQEVDTHSRHTAPQVRGYGGPESSQFQSPLPSNASSFSPIDESYRSANSSQYLERPNNPGIRTSPPPPNHSPNLSSRMASHNSGLLSQSMHGSSTHGDSFVEVSGSRSGSQGYHSPQTGRSGNLQSSHTLDSESQSRHDSGWGSHNLSPAYRENSPQPREQQRYLNITAPIEGNKELSLRAYRYDEVELLDGSDLGVGSFGKVCKARLDGSLICAAKQMHSVMLTMPKAREGFINECKFLSSFRHPNIVQYLGTFEVGETLVLLMELMDESLTSYLDRLMAAKASVPYFAQVNICHDVSLALAFLHSHQIIHRDLSSNNVLLLGDKRAKVTDFGQSTKEHRDEFRKLTNQPGTAVYMPPEALDADNDDPKYNQQIDCFSFGVLCIQILTRLFPKPSSQFSYSQKLDVKIANPELNRRKNHIDMIEDQAHPILAIAKDCLRDQNQRPSAQHLCKYFENLKDKERFALSKRVDAEESLEAASAKMQRSFSDDSGQMDLLRRDKDKAERELYMLRTNYERLSRDFQGSTEQCRHLEHQASSIPKLRNDLGHFQDENRRLSQQVNDLNRELQNLRREVGGGPSDLKKELDRLKLTQIPELRQEVASKNQEVDAAKKKLNKREMELREIIEARDTEIAFYKSKLDQTKQSRRQQYDFKDDTSEVKALHTKIGELERQLEGQWDLLGAVDSKGVSASLNSEELQFQLKKEREERIRTQKILDEMLQHQGQSSSKEQSQPSLPPESLKLSNSLPSRTLKGMSQQQRQRAWSTASKESTLQAQRATLQKSSSLNVELLGDSGLPCSGEGIMSITASLKSLSEKDKCVEATVTSSYEVSYTPVTRGRHKLMVIVNGEETSSHDVFVDHPIDLIKSPQRTINNLPGSSRVAVFTENNMLYVSDPSKRKYHVFDLSSNTLLDSIMCKIEVKGIAVDSVGNVYLTSDHWLHMYSASGERIGAVGSDEPGGGDRSFHSPTGVQVFDNQVYVCDTRNGRVSVFNRNLSFSTKFGFSSKIKILKKGNSSAQLQKPEDIAFGDGMKSYVLDSEKNAIVVFERLAYKGIIPVTQLLRPTALCYRNGHLLVTDWPGRCFAIYKTSGEFVRKVNFDGSPVGICTDADGYIYVANTINNTVVVY